MHSLLCRRDNIKAHNRRAGFQKRVHQGDANSYSSELLANNRLTPRCASNYAYFSLHLFLNDKHGVGLRVDAINTAF